MIARFLLLASVASPLLLAATAADAQTGPEAPAPAAPAAGATTGDVIVVTARRREEDLQSVPIPVSVIGGDTLEATGSYNVNRLTQLQPSLQFYSTNPRNSAANIRGIGAPFGLTNDGIEQGVGVYIDQVYNSRIAVTTFDFLDVERIEVLRGPQGTLYGKNTTAGAINVTTRAPSFTPEGRFEVSIGNLGYVQGRAAISGPLGDTVAARLAVSSTDRRGTLYNVYNDQRVNEQNNLGLRGSLLWRPTDTIDVTFSGDYNRQNPECCALVYVREGSTQRPLNRQYAALAAAQGYVVPSTDPFDRLTDVDSPLEAFQEIGGASLRAEWDLGPGTLTSITAWRFWNWGPSNDRDFIGLPITTVSANPSEQDQWSQELRYAGTSGDFDYVGGVFAYRQHQLTTGAQEQGPAASRWLINPSNPNAFDPSVLDGLRSENTIDFTSTSLALFGQLTWNVTDRLSLQPGIRLNYDKKRGSYEAIVTTGSGSTILNSDQRAVLAPQFYEPAFSDWNLSYDFTVSYDFSEDVMGYATYARSFKSGGINLSGLPLDASNNPILEAATVAPERVNHYELGLKTQFFDRALTFNLAAFWTEISDYQATVTNGQLGVLRGYLANADKVRVRGIEAEFVAEPADGLNLYASGAYTDGEYVRFTDAPCPPELSGGPAVPVGGTPGAPGVPGAFSPASCDISGQWLPGISKWAFSYGGEYALPATLFGLDGEFYLGVDGSYRSRFSSNPSRSIYTDVDGYALTNFRLGFRADNGLEVMGWVRNAFDTDFFEVLATQSGSTGLVVGQPGDPRTYGLTIRGEF